ncbi:MAG: succinate dehydrogenase, hydrophobic membrane anchor protein, partial [Gammaproteobacteria bacterium]|nr:succinate dehydrogenase, hydrophobic membrane anchor protein [Gammaproteobacteria bacterium]
SINGLVSLEYEFVVEFVAAPINGVLLALLCATLAYHSFLGVEVVIDDYVHTPLLRVLSLRLQGLAHVLIAVASVYAIARIGLNA